MKIGVLTFCSTEDNYGQVLQCYALQFYLNSMGHETYLIKYDASRNGKDLLWLLSLPHKILRKVLSIVLNKKDDKIWQEFKEFEKLASEENRKHPRCFSKFKEQYIKALPLIYNKKELYHTPPAFDIYIVGSDQVWGGIDPVYFLDWVSKGKKCIAYAPSFGGFQLSKTNSKILKFYLSKFDVVTVREKSGVDICKLLGREDVQLVLDPTFLLSKDDYRLLYKSTQTKPVNDYIFLYLLGKRLLNYILCIRFFIEVHSIVSASRFFHMPTYLRVVIECQSRFFPFFPAFSRNCPDYFLHTSGSSSFRSLSDLGAR